MAVRIWLVAAHVGVIALVAAAPGGKFLRAAPLKVEVVGDIPGILGSMKVFESKGLTPGALEAMEDAIELLVTSGDDAGTKAAVKQMNAFVGKARARREKAQAFDQKQINSHVESIKSCSLERAKLSNASLGANMTYVKKLDVDHKEHVGAHADCVFVEEAKDLLKKSVCGGVKNVDKECKCHSKITEKFGVRAECMNVTKNAANGKKCCDAYANLVRHRAECTNKKANMDFAHRQRTLLMRKLCTNYGKCYSEKVKAHVAVEKKVHFNEDNRQWVSLYRIQCLVDKFEKGKVTKTKVKNCKEQKYKVPAVTYPKTPAKDECVVPSFLQQEPEDGSDELQAGSDAALFGGSDEDESDSALYGNALLQEEPEDGSDELQTGSDAALFGGSDEDESDSALYGNALLQQEPEDGSDELQAGSDAALFGGSDEDESDSALYGSQDATSMLQAPPCGKGVKAWKAEAKAAELAGKLAVKKHHKAAAGAEAKAAAAAVAKKAAALKKAQAAVTRKKLALKKAQAEMAAKKSAMKAAAAAAKAMKNKKKLD